MVVQKEATMAEPATTTSATTTTTAPEFAAMPGRGVTLHVARAGPADGPLVILLHGFPEFWYGWRHQVGPLAESGFRVLAPDQRGYNLSEKPKGLAHYTLDALADDVEALIDAAGRPKAALVGHDWGGIVAWHVATRSPGRVDRLAVLNAPHPSVIGKQLWTRPGQALRSWYVFAFQLPWLPEAGLKRFGGLPLAEALRTSSRKGAFSDDDLARYRRAWSEPGAVTAMLAWYRAWFRAGTAPPTKPRVQVPALILWGKKDVALEPDLAQSSLALCDQGRLVFFPDATHWLQHEEPDDVNRRLLAFLREAAPEAPAPGPGKGAAPASASARDGR
jgi:pimeloyl-ACP methyl ester carboxylesterase